MANFVLAPDVLSLSPESPDYKLVEDKAVWITVGAERASVWIRDHGDRVTINVFPRFKEHEDAIKSITVSYPE